MYDLVTANCFGLKLNEKVYTDGDGVYNASAMNMSVRSK